MIQTAPFPRGWHQWHPFWTESRGSRVRMVSGSATLIMRDGMIRVDCENIFCSMLVRVSADFINRMGYYPGESLGDFQKFDQ